MDTIKAYLRNAVIVGFNIHKFDLPILNNEFKRVDPQFQGFDYKYALDLGQVFWKTNKKTLTNAYRFYTGGIMQNAHHAECDALACLEILPIMMEMHNLPNNIEEMHKLYDDKYLNYGSQSGTTLVTQSNSYDRVRSQQRYNAHLQEIKNDKKKK